MAVHGRVGNEARAPRVERRKSQSRPSDKEVTNCLARRERCRRGPFTSGLRSRARNDLRTVNRENVPANCVNVVRRRRIHRRCRTSPRELELVTERKRGPTRVVTLLRYS